MADMRQDTIPTWLACQRGGASCLLAVLRRDLSHILAVFALALVLFIFLLRPHSTAKKEDKHKHHHRHKSSSSPQAKQRGDSAALSTPLAPVPRAPSPASFRQASSSFMATLSSPSFASHWDLSSRTDSIDSHWHSAPSLSTQPMKLASRRSAPHSARCVRQPNKLSSSLQGQRTDWWSRVGAVTKQGQASVPPMTPAPAPERKSPGSKSNKLDKACVDVARRKQAFRHSVAPPLRSEETAHMFEQRKEIARVFLKGLAKIKSAAETRECNPDIRRHASDTTSLDFEVFATHPSFEDFDDAPILSHSSRSEPFPEARPKKENNMAFSRSCGVTRCGPFIQETSFSRSCCVLLIRLPPEDTAFSRVGSSGSASKVKGAKKTASFKLTYDSANVVYRKKKDGTLRLY